MIPVLYSETERDYGHGGIGLLTDTMNYLVTEEANGEFELYLEYPVQGAMFTELKNNRLIRAKPNDLDDDHVFRIYEVVKDLERQTVYIYATSITNDLGTNMVSSLTISSNTAQEALNMLKANLIEPTHFNFVSDITTRSSTEWEFRNPLNCIVGEDGSLVKYWGGEVKRTNDTVYLYARRGRDNVAVLREGKNLEGLEMTISTKGIVTKILPYMTRYDDATGEEHLIVGNIVTSPLVDNYPVKSIRAVDYTMYDDINTAAELNALASGYFTYQNPGVDKPKVSIDIDIMQLADSPLYSQYSKLESLGLFDSVSVYIPRFDVSVIVKVNKIEYNGLLERAEKIQCGDPVGNIFDDIKAGYTNMIFDTEAKITNIVQRAADGVHTIFRGPSEPTNGVKIGDFWYKSVGEFEVEVYQWNGMEWEPIITAGMSEAVRLEISKAIEEIGEVRNTANEAVAMVEQNEVAIFGKLDLTEYEANKTAVETELGKKLATATYNAQKQTQDALIAGKVATTTYNAKVTELNSLIAGKVATDTYNAKVTELNSLIATAQSKADTAAADLLKKADTTTVNAELAKKLATSTYNTKMTSLDTAISGHNTRIKATEDGLALTATKVEVDAVRTRMSEAETEISQNSDAIALKASQSSLDTTNGKLATAEASLVVHATQIASKVSQTDFNALNGRVGTAETTITQQAGQIALKASQLDLDAATDDISDVQASLTVQAGSIASKVSQTDFDAVEGRVSTAESSITQQASQIASKVSQTDFNALNGRVGTAESSITQNASDIALRVTTATYNTGIGSKENTITKSNTAPSHLNGRLWLDTSATPNILKRSTGTAWVKVTPTTPGEVGAYSAGDGSSLAGRVSTAESSITANTTAINLRATKTDLDAAKGRLTTAEGTISVQAGQIALKANQTTVDTLTGRVGTAETNISANTTAINLRATKSSVDTLTGRVTTAEGSITTQAGQIALRATTATVNALTGRVSTAESTISANTTAINLRATKTELTTAIDGVKVGGRNYLKNSYNFTTTGSNAPGIVRSITSEGHLKVVVSSGNGNYSADWGMANSKSLIDENMEYGEIVTFSMEVRSENSTQKPTFYFGAGMGYFPMEGSVGSKWSRIYVSLPWTTTTWSPNIGFSGASGTFEFRKGKLEKGNKATDWTPAPEDVDASISTVQSNLTVEAGKITALTTRVSGAESNITSVTQTVSGINTTISTLRTDVNGKATIVSLNAVKSTADGNKTTISNHAGRLTTVESNVNGLQTTVASKADQSQVTQLSNSISSTVSSAINALEIGGRNYLLDYNGSEYSVSNNTTIERYVYPSDSNAGALPTYITLLPNTEYTLSVWARSNLATARTMDMHFVHGDYDTTQYRAKAELPLYTHYSKYTFTFTTGQNADQTGYIRFDLNGSPNTGLAILYIKLAKLERGNKATDWSPAPEYMATTSQITQLNSAINLRVTKGELMSQINVEAGRTLISSSKLYLDSDTVAFSGRAFIPSAAITQIDAAKITTGTLNAAYVNVININVANIVGNTSSFIQSNWNSINSNINIDSSSITATDSAGNKAAINSSGEFRSEAGGTDRTRGIFHRGRIWFYASSGSAVLNIGSHPVVGEGVNRGTLATARAEKLVIGRYNDYLTTNINAQVNPYITLEYGGTIGDESKGFIKMWKNLSMSGGYINDVQYISGYELSIHSTSGPLFLGMPTWNTLHITKENTKSYGNIEMVAGYSYIGASDERLKNSITPTSISGLKVVNALEFYDYYWNDRPEIGKQFGLIAQRSPFVSEQNSDSGYWGINMNKLSLATAMAVKEVDTKVERIDTYVSQHELEIKILKERIQQLEEQ